MSYRSNLSRQVNWICGFRFQAPGIGSLPKELQTPEVCKALTAVYVSQDDAKAAIKAAYKNWVKRIK